MPRVWYETSVQPLCQGAFLRANNGLARARGRGSPACQAKALFVWLWPDMNPSIGSITCFVRELTSPADDVQNFAGLGASGGARSGSTQHRARSRTGKAGNVHRNFRLVTFRIRFYARSGADLSQPPPVSWAGTQDNYVAGNPPLPRALRSADPMPPKRCQR